MLHHQKQSVIPAIYFHCRWHVHINTVKKMHYGNAEPGSPGQAVWIPPVIAGIYHFRTTISPLNLYLNRQSKFAANKKGRDGSHPAREI